MYRPTKNFSNLVILYFVLKFLRCKFANIVMLMSCGRRHGGPVYRSQTRIGYINDVSDFSCPFFTMQNKKDFDI